MNKEGAPTITIEKEQIPVLGRLVRRDVQIAVIREILNVDEVTSEVLASSWLNRRNKGTKEPYADLFGALLDTDSDVHKVIKGFNASGGYDTSELVTLLTYKISNNDN